MNITATSEHNITRGWEKYRYRDVLLSSSSINLTLESSVVNVTCCSINVSFPVNYRHNLLDAIRRCNQSERTILDKYKLILPNLFGVKILLKLETGQNGKILFG